MVAMYAKVVVPIKNLPNQLDSRVGLEVVAVEEIDSPVIVVDVERITIRTAHDISVGIPGVEGNVRQCVGNCVVGELIALT
jgi:hypothetical protein